MLALNMCIDALFGLFLNNFLIDHSHLELLNLKVNVKLSL